MGDIELQLFSERLKELRQSLGLTQIEFIDGLGITASALSAYEKNLKNPSISVAKRIAEKYNISIDWLCGLTDKIKNTDEIETYSDILNIYVKLCSIDFALDAITPSFIPYDGKINLLPRNSNEKICILATQEEHIMTFMKEWLDMHSLLMKGTIKENLYKLWLSDKMKEYNIPIEHALPFN